jgi:L-amino acid N-acyltransferase YncA
MNADTQARWKQTIMAADYDIGLATRNDVTGILELQECNLFSKGGALSVPFSRSWFEAAVADEQVIVVRKNNQVVGYVVFSSFAAQAHVPLVNAMLDVYPGAPGAYNYGPICVVESERGRGLAGAMFAALRQRLKGREGIAFIRRDNATSLLAHKKMGMQEVAEFTHDGAVFAVLAYGGDERNRA